MFTEFTLLRLLSLSSLLRKFIPLSSSLNLWVDEKKITFKSRTMILTFTASKFARLVREHYELCHAEYPCSCSQHTFLKRNIAWKERNLRTLSLSLRISVISGVKRHHNELND